MSSVQTVRVALGNRGYDIVIGDGLVGDGIQAGARIAAVSPSKRAVVVTDHTVAAAHLAPLQASLDAAGMDTHIVTLAPGEASKSFTVLETLTETILAMQPDRHTVLVAFGGGVIGDLTGFAASILLRGIPFVQIPTTLLSQTDSAVGGKTAINSRHGKNLIGSFYQPLLVLADVGLLAGLPMRQRRAGYAEVVKYGLIDRPEFFAWLEQEGGQRILDGDTAALIEAVRTSCEAKAAIVTADEREQGRRALLNLGHTFGHALEQTTGYGEALLHGEAVAIGMVWAFTLSERLGLCPPEDVARVRAHLTACGLPVDTANVTTALSPEGLLAAMYGDKKTLNGALRLVLARGIGQAFLAEDVSPDTVLKLLQITLVDG